MVNTRPMQPKLRLKDRRRRLMWVKFAAGSTVVALLLGVVFYLSRLPDFTVATVRVDGARIVSAEALQAITDEKLVGTYGLLIPHANVFFIPKNEIEKTILSSYPEVAQVKISGENFRTLVVTVLERTTSAVWCQPAHAGQADGGTATETSSPCYAMDEDGFIFMKTDSGDGYVRYFGELANEPVGSTFLEGDFNTLHAFVTDTVKTVNRAADSVTVEANNDVNLAFVGGGVLRFVRMEDARATLDNIASVFASESFKTKRDFEYADFRYGNKVYVKFKGE